MLKPIYRIINSTLKIRGFYLHIDIYYNINPSLFKIIDNSLFLPTELRREIISYLPNKLELILRLDIPNTFPINTIFVSFSRLNNTFLFPEYNYTDEIDYIKSKIKKINIKYNYIDDIRNIDIDYLKTQSIDYLINEINCVYNLFSKIQCVH